MFSNFNENDLWRDKTKLLNLRFSKLPSAKVLLKLDFNTKDQVLYFMYIIPFFTYPSKYSGVTFSQANSVTSSYMMFYKFWSMVDFRKWVKGFPNFFLPKMQN